MKISYDDKDDAVYIRLIEGKQQCRTLQLTHDILLNIGENEELVGVEIHDAKNILGEGNLPEVILHNLAYKIEAEK